jgi:hypothetical protein
MEWLFIGVFGLFSIATIYLVIGRPEAGTRPPAVGMPPPPPPPPI